MNLDFLKNLLKEKAEARMGDVRRSELQHGTGLLPVLSQGYETPEKAAIAEFVQSRKQANAPYISPLENTNVSPDDVNNFERILDSGQISGGINKIGKGLSGLDILKQQNAERMKLAEMVAERAKITHPDTIERAKKLGFDTNQTWFHGTKADVKEFKPSDFGNVGPGVYLTQDPFVATRFGNNVMPLYSRSQNPLKLSSPDAQMDQLQALLKRLDAEKHAPDSRDFADSYEYLTKALENKLYAEMPEEEALAIARKLQQHTQDKLKSLGYDSIDSSYGGHPMRVVFDPSHIRQTNAKFDPKKKSSKNILAGATGAALLGAQGEE